ncbi:GNAT family N-acetyltransferase [Membranihabitans maritimus]|uniref:GNAT family N-acetyltransferase n=1 Tax=Membranihabitans maritimus TaxID=2904244 RepID=UPI001F022F88|nr:GNAT family N-acetyltransferase [Membranihabitans maritimus]
MINTDQTYNNGIQLRNIDESDLGFCGELVKQAGWNQNENDWRRMLRLDPEGCFLGEIKGRKVASAVFTRFENVVWISMVLVHKDYRRQGIGRKMFERIMGKLKSIGVKTVRLDATEMGVNLYKKFGFREEYNLTRFVREPIVPKKALSKRLYELSDLKEIRECTVIDEKITATNRENLFQILCEDRSAKYCGNFSSNGKMEGYVVIRDGRNGVQIGPCVALSSKGEILLDTAMNAVGDRKIIVDIPEKHPQAVNWALNNGFEKKRSFIRMYVGEKLRDSPENIWASFGPEKG